MQYIAYSGKVGQITTKINADDDGEALQQAARLSGVRVLRPCSDDNEVGKPIFEDWDEPLSLGHPVFSRDF